MHSASNAAQSNINRQVFYPQMITARSHLPRKALPGPARVCLDAYSARLKSSRQVDEN